MLFDDAQKLFPGIDFRTLAATFVFYIPGYRDLMLFGGCHVMQNHSLTHATQAWSTPPVTARTSSCSRASRSRWCPAAVRVCNMT